MHIASFDDLLQVARTQVQPQQLLFVFAGAELPASASAAQREQFEAGEGGELAPLMCVDKPCDAVTSFDAMCAEAAQAGPRWAIVFTAALPGQGGRPPSAADIDSALTQMIAAIKLGRLHGLLPFNRAGQPVHLA